MEQWIKIYFLKLHQHPLVLHTWRVVGQQPSMYAKPEAPDDGRGVARNMMPFI